MFLQAQGVLELAFLIGAEGVERLVDEEAIEIGCQQCQQDLAYYVSSAGQIGWELEDGVDTKKLELFYCWFGLDKLYCDKVAENNDDSCEYLHWNEQDFELKISEVEFFHPVYVQGQNEVDQAWDGDAEDLDEDYQGCQHEVEGQAGEGVYLGGVIFQEIGFWGSEHCCQRQGDEDDRQVEPECWLNFQHILEGGVPVIGYPWIVET